jgi:NADH:ubiquinone oxidoreductase subunit 6 (subunit J)
MILMNATFLALIFIIIYVGAIAVLFLFVIMMLNIKEDSSSSVTEERTSHVKEIFSDFFHFSIISFFLAYVAGNLYTTNFDFDTHNSENDIEESDPFGIDENLELPLFNLDIDTLSEIDLFGQLLFNYFL